MKDQELTAHGIFEYFEARLHLLRIHLNSGNTLTRSTFFRLYRSNKWFSWRLLSTSINLVHVITNHRSIWDNFVSVAFRVSVHPASAKANLIVGVYKLSMGQARFVFSLTQFFCMLDQFIEIEEEGRNLVRYGKGNEELRVAALSDLKFERECETHPQ